MNSAFEKIYRALDADGFNSESIVTELKSLREYFIQNLNEPGYVRMIRLAYEDIEANDSYTFEYTEGEDPKANLRYLIDLLADYNNKYNREELIEYRHMMEGEDWISPEQEWEEEEEEGISE